MATKSTYAEVDRRVSVVYGLIVQGQQRPAIVRYCTSQWGVSIRTADDYMARARENLEAALGIEKVYMLKHTLKRLNTRLIKDLNLTPLDYQ